MGVQRKVYGEYERTQSFCSCWRNRVWEDNTGIRNLQLNYLEETVYSRKHVFVLHVHVDFSCINEFVQITPFLNLPIQL